MEYAIVSNGDAILKIFLENGAHAYFVGGWGSAGYILSPSLYFAGKEAGNLYGFRYLMNWYSTLSIIKRMKV